VPAVLLVLAVCLGGLQLATQQLRLQDAAALAARSAARGSPIDVLITALVPGASVRVEVKGNLICARVTMPSTLPSVILAEVTLSATSCALGQGR
jgi:hypothetical protein